MFQLIHHQLKFCFRVQHHDINQLMEKGVDVVRFNFSHGSYEEHEKRMKEVKAERERVDRPVAIMLDTKGPEIRHLNSK